MKNLLVVLALAIVLPLGALAADTSNDAMSAALAWLRLVDAGKYIESGKETSALFRKSVTPEKWELMLQVGRDPLGKLVSRTEKSRKHAKTLPGAPDGDYHVLQFSSTFEKKKEAVETITMMRESDGSWRVAGYFIR